MDAYFKQSPFAHGTIGGSSLQPSADHAASSSLAGLLTAQSVNLIYKGVEDLTSIIQVIDVAATILLLLLIAASNYCF